MEIYERKYSYFFAFQSQSCRYFILGHTLRSSYPLLLSLQPNQPI